MENLLLVGAAGLFLLAAFMFNKSMLTLKDAERIQNIARRNLEYSRAIRQATEAQNG